MNELQVFQNDTFGQVRTLVRDGEPWFVAADVCKVFGDTNYRRSTARLDEDEKGVSQMDTPGGVQQMTIVSESGLYSLLFYMQPQKSRNVSDEYIEKRCAELKAFKRWITHEVIPTIRKHGAYATDATIDKVLADPEFGIRVLTSLKEEREARKALEADVARKDQIIGELQPKANYVDWILQNPGLVAITQIAKDYGLSAYRMNRILYELGVQYKLGNQWLLYSRYHAQGYTHSETVDFVRSDGRRDVNMITKWTQKGRLFIYNILRDKRGLRPLVEQERTA